MGMITRVRARLQSISLSHKLQLKGQDDKSAKTVCLLASVLTLPYILKVSAPFLTTALSIAYVLLVWPMMVTSWPFSKLLDLLDAAEVEIKEWTLVFVDFVYNVIIKKILSYKGRVEDTFLEMKNISAMVTQIAFFTLADAVFLSDQKLSCFYSLMFYNVMAYCISYVKQLIYKEDWSPYVLVSKTTNVKHLAMSTVKITLEFTKAVTFIITVVFTLLVFGLEQGLENYKPSWLYIIVTAMFYLITEKTFIEIFPRVLDYFALEALENLESLWAPVIIRAATGVATAILILPAIFFGKFRLVLIAAYVNLYLCYRDLNNNAWAALQKEQSALAKYRYATIEEVQAMDDVCAVCLQTMKFARVTPCHHMFHGDCLRRCLKERYECPMCKQWL